MAKAKTAKKTDQQLALQDANDRHPALPQETEPTEKGPWENHFSDSHEEQPRPPEEPPIDSALPRNMLVEFERGMNALIGEFGPHIPMPLLVGLLELKNIEFKESYRLQIERNLRAMAEAQTHGNA